MSRIIGTQEFMAAHKDHITSFSTISIVDTRQECHIEPFNGRLIVVGTEIISMEYIQDTGVYLYCETCKIEEEINLYEVEGG